MSEPNRGIYLDYNASTPIDPRVAAVMRPLLDGPFANPSATHAGGRAARALLDWARAQVAGLLGCGPDEIVFTSGGSEADNLALTGVFFTHRERGDHIITTAVEHPAILEPFRFLERLGARVTVIPVDRTGMVDPEDVRRAMTSRTILVSVMHANNEVGTIQPIVEIAAIAHEYGVLCHTDAAQSVGKIRTRVDELGVDLLTIAGHKLYAPKGVGALYVRRGVTLEPLIHGAGHEAGRRAGTESVLLAAALGRACELAADLRPLEETRRLRDRLWDGLYARFGDDVVLNGHLTERLPNTVRLPGVCVLDPDGDIVRELLQAGRAHRDPSWACYHTDLYIVRDGDSAYGLIGGAVGASFAVLIAEELFASGCEYLLSITSAGQIAALGSPPCFILIDRALRDEGTSYHYLPPTRYSEADSTLVEAAQRALADVDFAVVRGSSWTTDAPFRETATTITARQAEGVLAVEMEAAALYAFATARRRPVLCVAHVTNQMGRADGDFEKGEANGARDALRLIETIVGLVGPATDTVRVDP